MAYESRRLAWDTLLTRIMLFILISLDKHCRSTTLSKLVLHHDSANPNLLYISLHMTSSMLKFDVAVRHASAVSPSAPRPALKPVLMPPS